MAIEAAFYLLSVLCLISGSMIYELKCWKVYTGVRYNGPGMQNANISDIVECIKKCREYDSCQVVNMDTSTKGNCWYQVNGSVVVTVKDLVDVKTSESYIYDRTCEEITRGVDLNCWDVVPNYYLPMSTRIDRKTLADCLRECIIIGYCWSINWIVDTKPSCHILTIPLNYMMLPDIEDSPQSTNFALSTNCIKQNAGIDLRFWRVAPTFNYASSDLLQVDESDVQSCLNFCQSNENCSMVDFDQSTNPPCWAQTTKLLRGKLVDNYNSYNYLLLRKEYEAYRAAVTGKGCWKVNGSNPTGLTSDENRKLVRCLRECLQRSDCDTVSWHTDTSTCSVRSQPLLEPYFILDRECYKSVVGSVGGYKGGDDTTCWIETIGYHINGLTVVDKESVSECLEECLFNEDCRAADWEESTGSDTKCFIQTNKNLEVSSTKLIENRYAINYILVRECAAALFMVGKA